LAALRAFAGASAPWQRQRHNGGCLGHFLPLRRSERRTRGSFALCQSAQSAAAPARLHARHQRRSIMARASCACARREMKEANSAKQAAVNMREGTSKWRKRK